MYWLRLLAALFVFAAPATGLGVQPRVEMEEDDAGATVASATLVRHARVAQLPLPARHRQARRQRRRASRPTVSLTGRGRRVRPRPVRRATHAVDDDGGGDNNDDEEDHALS